MGGGRTDEAEGCEGGDLRMEGGEGRRVDNTRGVETTAPRPLDHASLEGGGMQWAIEWPRETKLMVVGNVEAQHRNFDGGVTPPAAVVRATSFCGVTRGPGEEVCRSTHISSTNKDTRIMDNLIS